MLWRVVRCRWNISSELCCALLTGPTGEGGFFKASDERCGTEDWGLTSPNPRLGSLHFRQQFQLPDSPDWCWLPLLSWSLWLLQPRTGNKNVVVFFVFTCHVWCIACHVPVIPSSDGRGGGRRCFVFAVFSCWDTRLLSPLSPAPQTWKRCWRTQHRFVCCAAKPQTLGYTSTYRFQNSLNQSQLLLLMPTVIQIFMLITAVLWAPNGI